MPSKEQIARVKGRSLPEYYVQATKSRAKAKGQMFGLTEEDIKPIVVAECPVLGIPMDYYAKGLNKNDTATIDRINNLKGYIPGNIWFISHLANSMKRNATPEQLIKFAKWVLNTYTGKAASINA